MFKNAQKYAISNLWADVKKQPPLWNPISLFCSWPAGICSASHWLCVIIPLSHKWAVSAQPAARGRDMGMNIDTTSSKAQVDCRYRNYTNLYTCIWFHSKKRLHLHFWNSKSEIEKDAKQSLKTQVWMDNGHTLVAAFYNIYVDNKYFNDVLFWMKFPLSCTV